MNALVKAGLGNKRENHLDFIISNSEIIAIVESELKILLIEKLLHETSPMNDENDWTHHNLLKNFKSQKFVEPLNSVIKFKRC